MKFALAVASSDYQLATIL